MERIIIKRDPRSNGEKIRDLAKDVLKSKWGKASLLSAGLATCAASMFPEKPYSVTIELPEASPLITDTVCGIFHGDRADYVIKNHEICKTLRDAVPQRNTTINISDQFQVAGLNKGKFYAHLKPSDSGYVIPQENYFAILEAYLTSAGNDENADPIPIDFLFSKWNLESKLGTLMASPYSSARGMNQFIRGTGIEVLRRYGALYGFEKEAEIANRIYRENGSDYGKAADCAEYRAMHERVFRDPTMSAVLGIHNTISGLKKLQGLVNSGKLKTPNKDEDGNYYLTAKDAYIGHFLGANETGAVKFFENLRTHADDNMCDVFKGGVCNRNKYFFVIDADDDLLIETKRKKGYGKGPHTTEITTLSGEKYYVPDRQFDGYKLRTREVGLNSKGAPVYKKVQVAQIHLNVAEFYERMGTRWGFSDSKMPNLTDWKSREFIPRGAVEYDPQNFKKAQDNLAPFQIARGLVPADQVTINLQM